MKRAIVIFMTVILALSLVACSGDPGVEEQSSQQTQQIIDETGEHLEKVTVTIPSLEGMVIDNEYIDQLEAEGFSVSASYDNQGNTAEFNTVLWQSPEAGTVSEVLSGQQVTLEIILSRGEEAIVLPELASLTLEEAVDKLTSLNLTYEIEYELSENIPAGCVIHTFPAASEYMSEGDKVTLYVCESEEERDVIVPNFTGISEDVIAQRMEQNDLKLGKITYDTPDMEEFMGKVISQSVAESSVVPVGTVVDVVIGGEKQPEETTAADTADK